MWRPVSEGAACAAKGSLIQSPVSSVTRQLFFACLTNARWRVMPANDDYSVMGRHTPVRQLGRFVMNALLQSHAIPATPWLSPNEIDLVRNQFAHIGRDADGFARDFYDTLFSIAPLVRAMFRGPMPEQRAKLLRMLGLLVSQLRSPEALAAPLASLGERHHGYGVLALDYDKVGDALLRTLALHLGEAFDQTARTAWGKVYAFVASTMQAAHA